MDKARTVCQNCGAVNAAPVAAEGKRVLCGRCRAPLARPGTVLETDDEAGIQNILANGSLPVLADFHSATCAPCHLMHPVVARLAERRRGELVVLKIDIDQHPELARRLEIRAVPTFIVFRRGFELSRTSGAMPEADFSLWTAKSTG